MESAPAAIPATRHATLTRAFTLVGPAVDVLAGQLGQAGLFGQAHHRDQPGVRCQVLSFDRRPSWLSD
jgi:hypothetical protein